MNQNRIPGHVERVGLFGGTFDPIHLGHLILAESALEELKLDRIIFIPAGCSPHKKNSPPVVTAAERFRMIEIAICDEPCFSVDDGELYRDGPSYTIDTVRSLLTNYPGVRFIYLIGADHIQKLASWHEIAELKNLVDFAVFDRAFDCKEEGTEAIKEFPVLHRRIDISSTEIRERLANGLSVRYLLPSKVHNHIMTNRLYTPLSSTGS